MLVRWTDTIWKAFVMRLNVRKRRTHSVLVHVDTIKGKGYSFAEKQPDAYHGVPQFNAKLGSCENRPQDFSAVFGSWIAEAAEKDAKICAITAAMKDGTGLEEFAARYPERFYDVGIAESHAVTFSAGLTHGGLHPVFAVYSTFLQRAYDQVMQDMAIANEHVLLAVDRAGIVGEDGETHQGIFDISFLSSIPGITILSPATYPELRACLIVRCIDAPHRWPSDILRGGKGFSSGTAWK